MDLTEVYDHLSFAEFKLGNVKRAAHYTRLMLQNGVWLCSYMYITCNVHVHVHYKFIIQVTSYMYMYVTLYTCHIHVLMRDERKKEQARSNKQEGKATQHT